MMSGEMFTMSKTRYRLILSHAKLSWIPRGMRTLVAYLDDSTAGQIGLVAAFLEAFGLSVIMEAITK